VVVVPTRSAARQLHLALAERANGVLPSFLTREELYDRLASLLPEPPERLTPFDRDSLMQAAAARALATAPGLSFRLRPGLIAEILRFYDQLRRQSQQVQRFEELLEETLGPGASAGDRGAERMRQQTGFLAATFLEYERRVGDSGSQDEHTLRRALIEGPLAPGVQHIVVAVADWIADPAGLYVADFDLLARLPRLDHLDIVSTDRTLAAGFHERLGDWLPDLEETDAASIAGQQPAARPVMLTPGDGSGPRWFTYRDREEELVAIARRIKGDRRRGRVIPLNRTAIVVKRPLPYLYLAPASLGAAGIPYQTSEGLPLAGEPIAAAVDLVLDFVETNFTRAAITALLQTPHLSLGSDERPVPRESVAVLNRTLRARRYLGDLARLEALAISETDPVAIVALDAALAAAHELSPLLMPAPASEQLRRLRTFLAAHARKSPAPTDDPFAPREQKAWTAIFGILDQLAGAHATHHDPPWAVEHLATVVRRWIGEQTFNAEVNGAGVHVLDDQAARFADVDDMAIVGLVEGDWPEGARRNIFYSPSLLRALGWPSEKERRAAEDARFVDLVASASERVVLSTFTLDEEHLATRSVQIDDLDHARLRVIPDPSGDPARIFPDEALTAEPPSLRALKGSARDWAEMRLARPPRDLQDFHGRAGPQTQLLRSITALETYLDCPFKFFAQHLLKLEEEPDDEEVMTPRSRGLLVHKVFEAFFRMWQEAGHRAITPENLSAATRMFAQVVDRELASVSEVEGALERTRLLGSSAAAGLGEAVLRMEAERPIPVVERLIEHRLDGNLDIVLSSGTRTVRLTGKLDRLDLLDDGTFRLVDYKLGWPPKRGRALQLPIYSLWAEQSLAHSRGRSWTLAEAAYLAFKGPRRVVPLFSSGPDRAKVLAEAQERLALALDGVEHGDFPPSPDDVFRCETCSFTSVCRKDYVGDV
jgi:RecB family exonuclease